MHTSVLQQRMITTTINTVVMYACKAGFTLPLPFSGGLGVASRPRKIRSSAALRAQRARSAAQERIFGGGFAAPNPHLTVKEV